MTSYVEDTSQWEAWQQDYQFGVFLIYPPDPPGRQVNALRAMHDPRSHSYCEAHISLTVPLPRELTEPDWEELASTASGIAPIAVQYGPLMNYLPHPGVCLAIEPRADLNKLRTALEAASVFKAASPRRYPFSAHMTIAEFISVDETKRLMVELTEMAPSGSFLCTGISYAVPDADFRFTERGRLGLGGDARGEVQGRR